MSVDPCKGKNFLWGCYFNRNGLRCPLVVVTCFWMAARDLKRHPGPQGPR